MTFGTRDRAHRNTDGLAALATLLIANSHLEQFYPYRWMAADGLLGNSLFFMLSGYGLICSSQRNRSTSFTDYCRRRLLRIYPSLLLVVCSFDVIAGAAWKEWTAAEYMRHLVYPTEYGYISGILPFYAIFFFLGLMQSRIAFPLAALAVALPYVWIAVADALASETHGYILSNLNRWTWRSYFFECMLLGGWMAKKRCPSEFCARRIGLLAGFIGIALFAYAAVKFGMVYRISTSFGPLITFYWLLHALAFCLLFLLFEVSGDMGSFRFYDYFPVRSAITMLGSLTLEIYLIHFFVIKSEWIRSLAFPTNVVVFFVVTLLLAWPVNLIAGVVRRQLTPAAESAGRSERQQDPGAVNSRNFETANV
jgi:peptidoglycan/LPS O-acetylase OafA/YrhL